MKSVLDALRGAVLGDERLLASAGKRLDARDFAAAARDARTVLGHSPDHPQALETLAAALLGLDDMDGATDAWRRRQALDRARTWTVRLCHDALIRPEPGAAGTAYVAELEDVVVDTTYWAIVDGDRLYNVEAYNGRMANSPFVRRRVSTDEKQLIVAYPADAPFIEQRCLFVGGDENYSHWITRSLLKLGLVDGPEYAGLPLLLHQPFRRFHVEFLELLDVARERLIQVTESGVVRCRRLVVPTQLSLRPGFAAGVAWLRRRLAQKLGPVPGPAEDLLFLSRAGTQSRVLVNEAELATALAPLGFRVVVPERMSVADQVRTFARARVIVAAHGAGLTNMIFAPREALVVEVTSTNIASMSDFRFMAAALGQRIETIVSDDYEMDPQRAAAIKQVNWDYRVDVEAVLALLRRERPDLFGA
jgi:capsular polysaccharide biosynthesis protein